VAESIQVHVTFGIYKVLKDAWNNLYLGFLRGLYTDLNWPYWIHCNSETPPASTTNVDTTGFCNKHQSSRCSSVGGSTNRASTTRPSSLPQTQK